MHHERFSVKFDPHALIDHFGGIGGAVEALKVVNTVIKPKTLQRQRERGNMPADVVASLAWASVKIGKPVNLYDCLLTRTEGTSTDG